MIYTGAMAEALVVPWRRLALTLLAPLAVVLLGRWPLPVFHLEAFARTGVDVDRSQFSAFAFGLTPIVNAFLTIEVAALIVRRWRPLRHGGIEGRARLRRRVLQLALILVAIQTFFYVRWMRSWDDSPPYPGFTINPHSTAGWLVVIAGLAAGPFVLLWLADLISERGLGNGMSVLIAAGAIPDAVAALTTFVRAHLNSGEQRQIAAPLVLTAMVVAALAASTARRPTEGWRSRPPRPTLLAPISALLPLSVWFWLVGLPGHLAAFTESARIKAAGQWLGTLSPPVAAVLLPLLAALVAAFCWLFARPSLVAPVWAQRWGASDAANGHIDALAAARAAFQRARLGAVAFVCALGFVAWLDGGVNLTVDVVALLIVACAALDVAGELRFRAAHGDVAVVTAEHRLYAVGPALAALEAGGIAHFPRALRHRALLAFWGPYLPVEILVPRHRADDARAILQAKTP
jgi:hypothetical protein